MASAKAAANAAVDGLLDGVLFGVVAGNHDAGFLFPAAGLAMATDESRRVAKHAIDWLAPHGGTAIGRWLMEARDRLVAHEDRSATRSCSPTASTRARRARTSRLRSASARGCSSATVAASAPTGGWTSCGSSPHVCWVPSTSSPSPTTWQPTSRRSSVERWPSARATSACGCGRLGRVGRLRQAGGTDVGRHHRRAVRVDDRVVDYPTGAWGDEAREYHVHLTVPAQDVGAETLAGRIGIVVDGEIVGQSLIRAVWTDDVAASTRISPQVAHYTGQAELADAIAGALEARAGGDDETAASRFGRAAQLALETGHEETIRLLARVVDIVDAETGTVRLRRDVDRADEMALDTRSTAHRSHPSRQLLTTVVPAERREVDREPLRGADGVEQAGIEELVADRLRAGEATDEQREDRRLHAGHALVDVRAASIAVVGVLGLGHRHRCRRRTAGGPCEPPLGAVAQRTRRRCGRRRARGRAPSGRRASAIDRPWPMIGSLWPAASPISTAPSTYGSAHHVSSPGYVAHGPPVSPRRPARSTGSFDTAHAARNRSVPSGPAKRCCPDSPVHT